MATLMDTLSIFEQFRATLGEDKAKVFAQTLGGMIDEAKNAATKDDIRQLRESLDSNVARIDATLLTLAEAQVRTEERLEELAQRMDTLTERVDTIADNLAALTQRLDVLTQRVDTLTQRMDALTERMDALTERMDALTERMDALTERMDALTERMDALTERMDALTERMDALAQRMDGLTAIVERLVIRSDRHEGTLLELKFRERLPSYLGRYLRRAKVLQLADLLDEVEPKLTSNEVDDFLRADILASGVVNGEPVYVIVEVSYSGEANDVERAARRAALLRKADLPAAALVACEATHPQTIAYAREQGVRMWVDGGLVDEKPPRHE